MSTPHNTTTSAWTTGGSLTVTRSTRLDGSTVIGDLLGMFVFIGEKTAAVTAESWTRFASHVTGNQLEFWYRYVGAGEASSYSISITGSGRKIASITCISGVPASDPFAGYGVGGQSSSSTVATVPSFSVPESLLLGASHWNANNLTSSSSVTPDQSPPMSEVYDSNSGSLASPKSVAEMATLEVSAGLTGDKSFTCTHAPLASTAMVVAVKSSAAGASEHLGMLPFS